jgi:hypothetical protein
MSHLIGKESRELESRKYGQVADQDEVQTEYVVRAGALARDA